MPINGRFAMGYGTTCSTHPARAANFLFSFDGGIRCAAPALRGLESGKATRGKSMTEPDRWETQRGDEWWYTDSSLEAGATFNTVPPALVIEGLHTLGPSLNAGRLYSFLWQSHLQFPDVQIRLVLSDFTRPLVEALVKSEYVRCELVKNPYSVEARFTFVVDDSVSHSL